MEVMMIVIMSYYSEGKGTPEIKFVPSSGTQASEVATYMAGLSNTAKIIKIYEIFDIKSMPEMVYPNNQKN